jgi:hypothetical protein
MPTVRKAPIKATTRTVKTSTGGKKTVKVKGYSRTVKTKR